MRGFLTAPAGRCVPSLISSWKPPFRSRGSWQVFNHILDIQDNRNTELHAQVCGQYYDVNGLHLLDLLISCIDYSILMHVGLRLLSSPPKNTSYSVIENATGCRAQHPDGRPPVAVKTPLQCVIPDNLIHSQPFLCPHPRSAICPCICYNKSTRRPKNVQPLDSITAFHNAFRRDMAQIDLATRDSARGKPGLAPTSSAFDSSMKSLFGTLTARAGYLPCP